jgi:DNA mismatch repair protein MutL
MPKIKLLEESLKNKIAAGEVIERPASVVRELLENSIDAGASSLEVEVSGGGVKLIRVLDDGDGMDHDDVELSLQRHATSKLGGEDDLFNITTMGFRGEALPSIASVSRLTLTTAPRGEPVGVSVETVGGEVKDTRESPSPGTSVEVRDLFFNTPVRKKFLKRESTELMHIIDTVTRLALSHPELRFVLTVDGQETMNLSTADGLARRLHEIYGGEFMDGMLEVEREAAGINLMVFVSRPGNFRNTRSHQMVFVNRRPVRDPSVTHAVYSALEGILPREMHPLFFVFLELDPHRVDFNVHPQKREVRFEDKESIYRIIKRGVMDAIRAGRLEEIGQAVTEGDMASGSAQYPSDVSYPTEYRVPSGGGGGHAAFEALPLSLQAETPHVYLGETFIAVPERGGLMLVDHHAAHERVLYERFLKGLRLDSHQLLFPRQIKLSPKEYMAVLENMEMLSEFGVEVEDFGHDTVVVRSLPDALDEADLRGILSDAAQEMLDGGKPGRSLRESVAARIACHSSVRGTKVLNREQLRALLDDLNEADDPEHCPHGRPTRIFYSMDEIKKIFKRK